MTEIEKKIGYEFRDRSLLEMALTHSSYSKEKGQDEGHNERLEYLGDAFLDAIIGEALFRMFPESEEGFLSKARASLVCERSLVDRAREIDLGANLRLGYGEEKTGGRNRDSILADAMEAVIGAVYMDGGFEKTKSLVLQMFRGALEDAEKGHFLITDYKTALQEELQARGINISRIRYVDAGQTGPDHDKVFMVRLEVCGKTLSQGRGKSKKQAQQNAAKDALMRKEDVI